MNGELKSDSVEIKEEKSDLVEETLMKEEKSESVEVKNEEISNEVKQQEQEQDENNHMAIISSIENQEVVSLVPEFSSSVQAPENQPEMVKNTNETQAVQVSTTKEQIVSEDFWKNEEVFKKIESIQKENAESEAKQSTFELPSVLKTLRSTSSTSTKPWLMKKKKNPEPQPEPVPAPETSVQAVPESTVQQTLSSENITPEMPAIVEAQEKNSEVVEISNTIENPIEGTA